MMSTQRVIPCPVRVFCPMCGYTPSKGEAIGYSDALQDGQYFYCWKCSSARYTPFNDHNGHDILTVE